MESRYIINIAYRIRDGHPAPGQEQRYTSRHWGKLDVGTNEASAVRRLTETRERFPSPEFTVTMTYWNCVGTTRDGWR